MTLEHWLAQAGKPPGDAMFVAVRKRLVGPLRDRSPIPLVALCEDRRYSLMSD